LGSYFWSAAGIGQAVNIKPAATTRHALLINVSEGLRLGIYASGMISNDTMKR